MFVCICNGHRDSDIAAAAEGGARCIREIYAQLGGAPQCGECLEMAESVLAEATSRGGAGPVHEGARD